MLQTVVRTPLDAIQMCRDIVEGNINAMRRWPDGALSIIELQARIYTDFEILAMNQPLQYHPQGDMLIGVDPGDESDFVEPASASR